MDIILEHLRERVKETNKVIENGENIPQLLFEVLKNQKVIMAALIEIKPIRHEH